MNRRNFLKRASGCALVAVGAMTGMGRIFAGPMSVKEGKTDKLLDKEKIWNTAIWVG